MEGGMATGNFLSRMAPRVAQIPIPDHMNTLDRCFDIACQKMRGEAQTKGATDLLKLNEFLGNSLALSDLQVKCDAMTSEEGGKSERLAVVLGRIQTVGDTLTSAAPEMVGLVWFGVSTLISIGNLRNEVRQTIFSACGSIAEMIDLCMRLERRKAMHNFRDSDDRGTESELWQRDVPELLFAILDFLWRAKPHTQNNWAKSFGHSMKETFSGNLQKRVDSLNERYKTVSDKAQILFEAFLADENIDNKEDRLQILADLQIAKEHYAETERNMLDIMNAANEILEATHRQALIYKLDHECSKLKPSRPQEQHFQALHDRFLEIISDRPILNWLLQDTFYNDWKSFESDDPIGLLCIKAPRGHGKTMAMVRVLQQLQEGSEKHNGPIILSFFFKSGDKDIQETHTALESLLAQLLQSSKIRSNTVALQAVLDVLEPRSGDERPLELMEGTQSRIQRICHIIRMISERIENHIYVMVDAVDECLDRKERGVLKCLQSLTANQSYKGLRVMISARDTIDVAKELSRRSFEEPEVLDGVGIASTNQTRYRSFETITITRERNSEDLQNYLQHDLRIVLERLIDKTKDYFQPKLNKLTSNIFGKAKGDFTQARLIIAHLQQPSKKPLERKIDDLPDSIGEIYMKSLEALKPSEQEFIATALKWVVWSVSAFHVTELSDQYREIYQFPQETVEDPSDEWKLIISDESSAASHHLPFSEQNLTPEAKEIIHHLGEAGKDFFKYDPTTGVVSVDISIREWVTSAQPTLDRRDQKSKKPPTKQGFKTYQDEDGYTVLKFTFTPSFVKHGNILTPLFDEREAQMSLTLDILRTLNNKNFQRRYMSWEVDWLETREYGQPFSSRLESTTARLKYPLRYEVEHWPDHIRILQKWWTTESIKDPWWSELLKELALFSRKETWHRWNIQRPRTDSSRLARSKLTWRTIWESMAQDSFGIYCDPHSNMITSSNDLLELLNRYFQTPIHYAAEFGLQLLIDQQADRVETHGEQYLSSEERSSFVASKAKIVSIAAEYLIKTYGHEIIPRLLLQGLNEEDEAAALVTAYLASMLNRYTVSPFATQPRHIMLVGWLIKGAEGFSIAEKLSKWLHSNYEPNKRSEFQIWLMSDIINSEGSHDASNFDFGEGILSRLDTWINAMPERQLRKSYLMEATGSKGHMRFEQAPTPSLSRLKAVDKPDAIGVAPLYLGAEQPEVMKALIRHGADINCNALSGYRIPLVLSLLREMRALDPRTWERPSATVISFETPAPQRPLVKLVMLKPETLHAVQFLLAEGASIGGRDDFNTGAIHYAAAIQDLRFFRQVCRAGEWDPTESDINGMTPLHFLFLNRPDLSKVDDTLEIANILIRMSENASELVNIQDNGSESPLAYAVRCGFVEGVNWLIRQKVDIQDENILGANCFHHLAELSTENFEVDVVHIMESLLKLGLDCTKADQAGETPLHHALRTGNTKLTFLLLDEYQAIKDTGTDTRQPSLAQDHKGRNILHYFGASKQPREVLTRLKHAVGNDIEIYHKDQHGCTPMLYAIHALNFDAVRNIMSLGPYRYTVCGRRYDEIQSIFYEFLNVSLPREDSRTLDRVWEIQKARLRILNFLLQSNAYTSLTFYEFAMFSETNDSQEYPAEDSDNDERVSGELSRQGLVRNLSLENRDNHGWNIADILGAIDRSHWLPEYKGASTLFTKSDYLTPSRLCSLREEIEFNPPGGLINISDDGLKLVRNDRTPNSAYNSDVWFADHPIPPLSTTTYFEFKVQGIHEIPDLRGDEEKISSQSPVWIGIGSKGGAIEMQNFLDLGYYAESPLLYGSSGHVREFDKPRGNRSTKAWYAKPEPTIDNEPEPKEKSLYNYKPPQTQVYKYPAGDRETYIGCGINPLERKAFFTLNGKMLPGVFTLPPKRYYPVVITRVFEPYTIGDVEVNFGSSKFEFKDANVPEWQWDGTVPEVEDVELKESWHAYYGWSLPDSNKQINFDYIKKMTKTNDRPWVDIDACCL